MACNKLTCIVRKDPDFQECDFGNSNIGNFLEFFVDNLLWKKWTLILKNIFKKQGYFHNLPYSLVLGDNLQQKSHLWIFG